MKGFTLIELLAVIVLLAIISLIATPIVLSIISSSKENSSLRSAEMYLDAVEYSIADTIMNNKTITSGAYHIMKNGNICIGTYSDKTCGGNIIKVEVKGEVPKEGSTITIDEGKIKGINLLYGDNTVMKDDKGNLVYEKILDDICEYQNNGVAEKTAGAKYTCEVKPGTSYNFYVLTTPKEGSKIINLIMDRNIYYDGIAGSETTSTNKGIVPWMSDSNYGCGIDGEQCTINDKGPVTAITYLYNATKDWINISPVNYTYMDKEIQGTTQANTSYTSFVSTNGLAVITSLDKGTITMIGTGDYPLRARMPIYSSDASITEVVDSNGSNNYLYENLDGGYWDYDKSTKPTNNISGIYGYWTLSSRPDGSSGAWYVNYDGHVRTTFVGNNDRRGVRPVITLKI